MESVEQLTENNFYIGYEAPRIKYWLKQSSELLNYPDKYYMSCNSSNIECILRMKSHRNIALVSIERGVINLERANFAEPPLEKMNVHLLTAYFSAFFSKGFPLFPLINRMLQYLIETGFVMKICEKYDKLLRSNDEPLIVRSLSLQHMVAPLFVWIVGIFLSVAVFSYEKNKYKRTSTNN
ncbi:hypothetical protein HHI36_019602 [Cryptolaemus montrouzieri]|uniref:Uncharacterized protein n=1 Tax=Cryptolaemus montrouzieri TaxID=559131 RepID=A0ABD2N8Z9_9CUCU